MAHSVVMPELGESVTEGTITQWLKSVGDTVEVDESLLEVSTDKVDTEVPSPVAGVLLEIKFEEDDTVDVGAVIAIIGEPGEESSSSAAASAPKPEKEEAPQTAPAASQTSGSATDVV
ncbi:biotin/lipoyl-containing protein, partial [Corynebacterium kutscheri]